MPQTTETPVNDCPFCLTNNLLQGEIIAETASAYLIRNQRFPEAHLIIPKSHVTNMADLPDNWWGDFKQLQSHTPNLDEYNLSLNVGPNAGQTIPHLHFWIIPRHGGQPASGKGLASLIDLANDTSLSV